MERGAYSGAGLLAELVTPWSQDSHWRSSWRTVSSEKDLTLEQGQGVKSPPLRRKERQRHRVMN